MAVTRNSRFILISLIGTVLLQAPAWAANFNPLYTATRANAMGGAHVGLADDEECLFINPAGLAGMKGFSFNYVAGDVEMSWDTITTGLTGASMLTGLGPDTLNKLMGKNIFTSAQIAPSLVMPGFGISIISNGQFQLLEQDKANPTIRLGYQITNGVQVGTAFSVFPKRQRAISDLRVGVAAKLLWRQGGYHNLDFLQMLSFTQAPVDQLHAMNGPYSRGIGVDVGLQYVHTISKTFSLQSGLAFTDIGDTTFEAGTSQPMKSNLSLGFAAIYKLRKIKATLAYDYQHVLQDMDFGSKTHVGLELQVPFIGLDVGLDQMQITYGAFFDVWIARITAASYGQELATYAGQNAERRYALRVSLKL